MLIRHTAHYFIASLFSAAIGLASAVAFTRLLSPAEYGIYVIGVSTAGVLSAVLFTWVRLSVLRYQSEGGTTDIRATALVAYLISVCASPLALGAVALASHASTPRLLATLVFTLGLGLFEMGQELLKARLQTTRFMLCSILRSLSALTLGLLAAYFGGGGLGQLLMAGAAYFVASLVFAPSIWEGPMARLDPARLRIFLRFGAPATVSGLVFALHSAMDRLVVAHVLGESAAGQYGAAADLTRQLILIPAASVAAAAVPLAVRALALNGPAAARQHLAESFELLAAIVAPAVLGVALTSDNIADLILGPQFRDTAHAIMPILAFAWLFQSMSQSYVHASFHLAQKSTLLVAHGAGTLAANAALMLWLSSAYGLRGAAMSLALAEAISLAFGFALTRWSHPLPLAGRGLTRVALASAAMAAAVTWVKPLTQNAGSASLFILAGVGAIVYIGAAIVLDVAGARVLVQRLTSRMLSAPSAAA